MHGNLKKKILILGGSSEIGYNLVNSLIAENYKIFIHYNNNKPNLKENKDIKLIKKNFSKIKNKNFKTLLKDFKNFDIIINLIGFVDNKTYQSFDIETINKSLNINFIAPMLIYRNSINYMKLRKFGRIINCSSIGTKFGGGENTFSYSLAKHCSEFIPSEIRRLARYNVLFNNIKLGVVKTKLHKNIKNKNITNRIKKIPARRSAKLDEIINLIKFFIRDNSYIASETVNISGGE